MGAVSERNTVDALGGTSATETVGSVQYDHVMSGRCRIQRSREACDSSPYNRDTSHGEDTRPPIKR